MNTDIRADHPADTAPTAPGPVTPESGLVAGVTGRGPGSPGRGPGVPERVPGPGAADWAPTWPAPPSPWAEVDSPTRPQWVQPEPPWVTSFAPPGAAGGMDHGPWSPRPPSTPGYVPAGSGGSPPPPPFGPSTPDWHQPPPPPDKTGRSGIALILVAVIVSAVIGLGIGSRLHRPAQAQNSSLAPLTPFVPGGSASPTPTDPSSGGSGSAPATGSGSITSSQGAAVAAKVTPGVVDINTRLGFQNGAGAGTGMILSSSGEILTNNHVIDGATSITVTVVSTGHKYTANVVGTDPTEDIAVLQLQGASGLKTIPIGDSSGVAVGDPVVAIGNAGGVGGAPAVVTGTVQALNQTVTASDQGGANAETLNGVIQINAPLQPGDSGGPLANKSGQVIGIDTAASSGGRFNSGAPVGFAIPIAHAIDVAGQIQGGHASATVHLGLPAFLGVSISSTASGPQGAVITGVQPSTPAASVGLAAGDTVTSLNGQAVDSAKSLSTLTRSHKPGDKVTLAWTDTAGASHSASVTLGTGPAD
jgi:S1-C subfamily serine protease